MQIIGKKEGYSIALNEGETISILINDNPIYEYTVPPNKRTEIGYSLHENNK